jgi:Uma2 family endonuclease
MSDSPSVVFPPASGSAPRRGEPSWSVALLFPPQGEWSEEEYLAIEVVSEREENRERDLHVKPKEYAEAGIPAYWIVDPEEAQITVLRLDGKSYRPHGIFKKGETATSVELPGLEIPVAEVFAVGEGQV